MPGTQAAGEAAREAAGTAARRARKAGASESTPVERVAGEANRKSRKGKEYLTTDYTKKTRMGKKNGEEK